MSRPFVALLAAVISLSLVTPGLAQSAAAQAPPKKAPRARRATPAPAPATAPAPAPEAPPAEPPPPTPATDVKVVTAYTQGAQVSQNTTYIRGPRQRVEFPGMISIDQCDLQRAVMLSPTEKRYRVQAYATPPSTAAPTPDPGTASPFPVAAGMPLPPAPTPRGGVVTMTTTLTDTLERQQMFGLEARRIKTVIARQASPEACDKTESRLEIDAWYVDLPKTGAACTRAGTPAAVPPPAPDACTDRLESRVVGDVTLGFPVKTVTTTVTGEGEAQETTSTMAEATALEITRLDAALFDVPADYVEAKSFLELTPSVAKGNTLADALFGSTADGTSQAAPKRAGITRIGVLEPVNRSTHTSLQTRAVRQELVTRFTKSPYEALPLSGSSPEAIAADIKRLECDYVLVAEVTEVKSSKAGRLGGMLKMASGGGPPKDRHEVKMTYRLYPADGLATVKASGEVKADNGGGFGIGSALRVAAFAGQMYMGFASAGMLRGMGGGLGMGLGMMNPMYGLASSGGIGAMGGGFFDPRSMAMTSMALGLAGSMSSGMGGGMDVAGFGGADAAEQEVFQVVSEASKDIAAASTAKLKSGK